MAAADRRCQFVFERALLQRRQQRIDVGDQNVGGALQLHRQGSVEHIRRRHALMHEARFRPDDLAEMRQERDDVVLDLALDRVDARRRRIVAALPFSQIFARGFFRDDAEFGQRVGGVRFDLEPDAEFGFGRPDRHHFGAGVAGDHREICRGCIAAPSRTAAALAEEAALPPPRPALYETLGADGAWTPRYFPEHSQRFEVRMLWYA